MQPQCIKTTQTPLLQKSLVQSDNCAHYVQSHSNWHSAAHMFPPSASDHYLPLFIALLAAQRPSHPVAPGPLVNQVSRFTANVIFWLALLCPD